MEIKRINSNQNFTAKLDVFNTGRNAKRWANISAEFAEQTKKLPDYTLVLDKDKKGVYSLFITSLHDGTLSERMIFLSKKGSEVLNELSDKQIVQKLKKILNITKKHDDIYNLDDNKSLINRVQNDLYKIEDKYGTELDVTSISWQVADEHADKLNAMVENDSVLSTANVTFLRKLV